MEWQSFLTYGAIGIVVVIMMSYLNKSASKEIEKNEKGQIELRINKLYQVLGWVSVGIAFVFIIVALYYKEEEMYIASVAMLLLFGGLGTFCLMYYYNHKVQFDEKIIIVRDWRGEPRQIKWSEINKIKFNSFSGYLTISGLEGDLTLHQHLVGLKQFAKEMEKQTKWNAKDLKLPFR